ncbi:WD repeat-containing protein 75 [Schistocerca nitens]|uniref:WD repeat-containing protein 75 n=1 Tax=Schistocerca nitens TaxID=7011 RepID=UPI002118C650|nr:WD repeat-containing protein 75 [Schistocerca nitens]
MGTMEKECELIVSRKGGGSVIDRQPVFSKDGRILFVVWGPVIRSYSIQTGELIDSYEGLKSRAVGVVLNPDNSDHIVACSQTGELIEWNWRTAEQKRKLQLDLNYKNNKPKLIVNFYVARTIERKIKVFLVWGYEKEKNAIVDIFNFTTGKISKTNFGQCRVDSHSHSTAIGGSNTGICIAGIKQNELFVISSEDGHQMRQFLGGQRWFTCVACHPTEACVATGDNSGRLLIWRGFNPGSKPVYGVYHWHTLPVRDVRFSSAGTYVYTGGGEGVLVKWSLDASQQRSFLPRLPASIAHISLSSDNRCIGISTDDNAIQIIDPQFKHLSVVQHFTWGVRPVATAPGRPGPLFPARLTRDPRTQSLVLNGRTGHIQFFSVHSKTLLYNLDVTGQNYLTQERGEVIVNTEVIKVAFSSAGDWLATVEQRDDNEISPELRLKFWIYDSTKQTYSLNTAIELPHKSTVYALEFQPSAISNRLLAVTTGDDQKFRIWGLTENSSLYSKGVTWICESVGFYQNLPVGAVSFSTDSSLLAVAFGCCVTVWIPETNELQCSLTHTTNDKTISQVNFGQQDCVHLIVSASPCGIYVWNVITLSLMWMVPFKLSILAADPKSNLMAAVSAENELVIFRPNCPQPMFRKPALVDSEIVAAAFVPHTSYHTSLVSWQQTSQLYFLDSNQELLVLEEEVANKYIDSVALETVPSSLKLPQTPFSALIAEQTKSSVLDPLAETHLQLGIPGDKAIRELLKPPAHTMPPISLLCAPFLRALIVTKSRKEDGSMERNDDEMEAEDSGMETDDSETSVVKPVPPTKSDNKLDLQHKTPKVKSQKVALADIEAKLESILHENVNWSFALLPEKSSTETE